MKAMSILKIVVFIITGFVVVTLESGQWEVFTGKNDVRDIALSDNTLWAATTGGVVAWDLNDTSYKSYTTLDGLISCNINQVAIDNKGSPWVATKDPAGLFVYENNEWKRINVGGADKELADKFISGLEVDRFGNVWVYIRDIRGLSDLGLGLLWHYDGQTWHNHEGVEGPLALDLQKNLLAVDSLSNNHSTQSLQFRIISFNGSEFVSKWRLKIPKEVFWPVLAHIAQDRKGKLWVSYYGERWDETIGVVCDNTIYNTLDGLAHDNVRSITADESGAVWCATDGGISKFTESGWISYDTKKGVASNHTYRILIGRDNTLYVATSRGISILKSNRFKTLKTINDPSHNNYTNMVIDNKDAVLLAGSDRIAIYYNLQWKLNFFRNIRVRDFIKSKEGTLYAFGNEVIRNEERKGWILKQGTGGSTFVKAFSCRFEKYNQFLSPALKCSGNDSCFWLTDYYGNLILINKQTTSFFPPLQFGIEGMFPRISCMLSGCDGRSVWIGYAYSKEGSPGIIHFDGNTVKKRITRSDGLASNWINAIARDSSENLWFAANYGVTVLSNTKLTTYFKDSDDKVFGDCNSLFVDVSGMVWTHAERGIARFDGSSWILFDSAAVSPALPYARYSGSHTIQDKSGTIWFGTLGSGLLAYKKDRWYQFTTHDGLPGNRIRSCVLDSKDNLWILTDHGIAMRKSDETSHRQVRYDFLNPGKKRKIKQCGSRFFVSSKDKPKMIGYTLFDLRGRVVYRKTIYQRKSFVLPEKSIGSGLRILSINLENSDKSQYKYFLKLRDIK